MLLPVIPSITFIYDCIGIEASCGLLLSFATTHRSLSFPNHRLCPQLLIGVCPHACFTGGDLVAVYNERCVTFVFDYFAGSGNQVVVGGGIAVFARNYQLAVRVYTKSTTAYSYTVAGYGKSSRQ